MAQDLNRCTIGILNPDHKTVGTGFLILTEPLEPAGISPDFEPSNPTIAVTCAHVANAAHGKPGETAKPGDMIEVYLLCDEVPIIAEVMKAGWSPVEYEDLAFLKLKSVPAEAKPVGLSDAGYSGGHEFLAIGFPDVPTAWKHAQGHILGMTKMKSNQVKRLELTGNSVEHGMSGGPVLDLALDRIVGMITAGKDFHYERQILALPVETIRAALPSVQVESVLLDLMKYNWRQITRNYSIILLALVFAVIQAVFSGVLWNATNSFFHWPYYTGGSGNEPIGFSAFLWGFLTILPIILFALLFCSKVLPGRQSLINKLPVLIASYALLGGSGGWIFYNSHLRQWIEAMKLGYEGQEMIIVLLWSGIISAITSLPYLGTGRTFKGIFSAPKMAYQILFAVLLTFSGVWLLTMIMQIPPDQVAKLRGVIAGIALRGGMFLGVVLAIWTNTERYKR